MASETVTLDVCPLGHSCSLQDVALVVTWTSPKWLLMSADLIERLHGHNHRVRIIDLSLYTFPTQVASFSTARRCHPIFSDLEGQEFSPSIWTWIRRNPSFNEMDSAIQSELATRHGGQSPRYFRLFRRAEEWALGKMASEVYQRVRREIRGSELWIIPNGRLAHQRALYKAASERTSTFILEESRLADRYFLRGYRVHDRVRIQHDVILLGDGVSSDQMAAAESWFRERMNPTSLTNRYSYRFEEVETYPKNHKTAVFFSSSRDELTGLDLDWSDFGWNSQYDAFDALAPFIIENGYNIIMRLHPNLQNKSIFEQELELTRAKKFCDTYNGELIMPSAKVNSYSLVAMSEVVCVSRSTLGLEAASQGKHVIQTSSSYYDLLGLSYSFTPRSTRGDLQEYLKSRQDRSRALKWVAVQAHQDFEIKSELKNPPKTSIGERIMWTYRPINLLHVFTKFFSYLGTALLQLGIRLK